METERRHGARKRLNRLAYIRIGADNGGLVSDLGEGGLGFHTIAAIEREGPLSFWFTLDAADRIQATGKLAWTDETRKVGGLKFTDISDEALLQIREWMGGDGGAQEEPPAPPRPPAREPVPFSQPARKSKSSAIPVTSSPIPETPVAVAPPPPVTPTPPRPEPLRVMASPQHWSTPVLTAPPREVVSPEMVRGFTSGLTILAIVLTIAALLFGYHREIGQSLVRLGGKLTGESPLADVQPAEDTADTQPPASYPQASLPSPNPTAPSSTPVASPAPAPHTPPQSNPASSAQPNSSPLQAGSTATQAPVAPRPAPTASPRDYQNLSAPAGSTGDIGKNELDTASQFLNPVVGPPNYTEAAKWLWMAVEKGNPTAEVLLSDLFIRGVGVPKNCIQARVLLNAAVRHGSYVAVSRLKALNRAGCS